MKNDRLQIDLKETLAYVMTGLLSGLTLFDVINGIITTGVLLATLIYWIRKNIYLKKR